MNNRKQMRVLMISGRADYGGGPEHVYQLTKAIGEQALVYVACPREEPYWTRFTQLLGSGFVTEIPHRRFSLPALLALVRFITREQIDIVHAHGRAAGIFGRIAALITGKRCVYTPHGGTPVGSLKTLCYAGIELLLSLATSKVIAVSQTEGKTIRSLCARRWQLEVIPNGVAIPPENTLRGDQDSTSLRVLHATRFVYQKNSELLIDILENLRGSKDLEKFRFVILGDGPDRPAFEAKLREHNLESFVKLIGAVPNPGDYLNEASCLVSTSRWEGLPLVVLEAMARAVPVIATDVIGNRDAVADNVTGFLYSQASPEAAAQRLAQLANDPQLRDSLARGARRRAEMEFSVNAMANSTLALYRNLHADPPWLTHGETMITKGFKI